MKNYKPPILDEESRELHLKYMKSVSYSRALLADSHLMSYSRVQELVDSIHLNLKRAALLRSKFRVNIDTI